MNQKTEDLLSFSICLLFKKTKIINNFWKVTNGFQWGCPKGWIFSRAPRRDTFPCLLLFPGTTYFHWLMAASHVFKKQTKTVQHLQVLTMLLLTLSFMQPHVIISGSSRQSKVFTAFPILYHIWKVSSTTLSNMGIGSGNYSIDTARHHYSAYCSFSIIFILPLNI